jgi:hypothetical protein
MDLINTIVSGDSEDDASSDAWTEGAEEENDATAVTDDLAYIAAAIGNDTEVTTTPGVTATATVARPITNEDSDSDSSDSDSDSGSDTKMDLEKEEEDLEELCAEEEDGGGTGIGDVPRTKNELVMRDLYETTGEVDIDDTNELAAGDELILVGEVHSHVPDDRCLVVRAYETTVALAEDTTLYLYACSDPGEGEVGLRQMDRKKKYVIRSSSDTNDSTAAEEGGDTQTDSGRAVGQVDKHNIMGMGKIQEVFGPLHKPYYVLRYKQNPISLIDPPASSNKDSEVSKLDSDKCDNDSVLRAANAGVSAGVAAGVARDLSTRPGSSVYFLQRSAQLVKEDVLATMFAKGSDASNVWDEEVTGSDIDYSDDEQEKEAKATAKAELRQRRELSDAAAGIAPRRVVKGDRRGAGAGGRTGGRGRGSSSSSSVGQGYGAMPGGGSGAAPPMPYPMQQQQQQQFQQQQFQQHQQQQQYQQPGAPYYPQWQPSPPLPTGPQAYSTAQSYAPPPPGSGVMHPFLQQAPSNQRQGQGGVPPPLPPGPRPGLPPPK